jgi:hypothetical protein
MLGSRDVSEYDRRTAGSGRAEVGGDGGGQEGPQERGRMRSSSSANSATGRLAIAAASAILSMAPSMLSFGSHSPQRYKVRRGLDRPSRQDVGTHQLVTTMGGGVS